MPELPFASPAFAAAWADWKEHRKQIKRPLSDLAVTKQFNILKKMGERASIEAIEHSISCGYQGVFAPHKPLSAARQPDRAIGWARDNKTVEPQRAPEELGKRIASQLKDWRVTSK